MKLVYEIKKEDIARYELEIARSGCCKGLARISFIEQGSLYKLEIDNDNQKGICQYLEQSNDNMFDTYHNLLSFIRTLCSVIINADDYLIPADHLSLLIDDITYSSEQLYLKLSAVPKSFQASFVQLLKEISIRYPYTHADYLLTELPDFFDAKQVNRLILLKELDLYGI